MSCCKLQRVVMSILHIVNTYTKPNEKMTNKFGYELQIAQAATGSFYTMRKVYIALNNIPKPSVTEFKVAEHTIPELTGRRFTDCPIYSIPKLKLANTISAKTSTLIFLRLQMQI